MPNSGRGSENGGPRSHRRVDPDELTLDDLFRPEPQQHQPAQPRPGYEQPEYYLPVEPGRQGPPAPGDPWRPQGQEPGQVPGTGQPHGMPQQGQPWGAGAHAAPQSPAGAADETQLISPYQGSPEPGVGAGAGAGAGAGDADETRQIPQIPQNFPPVPPRPSEPPQVAPQQGGQQGGHAASSPFTIRPGLPTGAYGEEPSYAPVPDPEPEGADQTQMLPPVQAGPPPQAQAAGYGGHPSGPAPDFRSQQPSPQPAQPAPAPPRSRRAAPDRSGRRLSPAALAGIVVAGCAVAGLVAGAALSGGDGDDGESQDPGAQKAAATSSTPAKQAEDPAKAQAEDLDALLKDSNDSRSAVISAVEQIKRCKNLGGAAKSLRDAAAQRNDLVSRLAELPVDKLAGHKQLTASLNKAWASSASADNHYAAWADDVAGKKGCKKGRARTTAHAQQGNRASGEATQAKRKAAALWNTVAKQHGLTERTATQL